MKFLLIKRSYFCVLHPLLGPQIKFMIFLENQPTLVCDSLHHGAVLFGKLTFPRVTENDSMKALSPGDESKLKSKVTLRSVQP